MREGDRGVERENRARDENQFQKNLEKLTLSFSFFVIIPNYASLFVMYKRTW